MWLDRGGGGGCSTSTSWNAYVKVQHDEQDGKEEVEYHGYYYPKGKKITWNLILQISVCRSMLLSCYKPVDT